MDLDELFERGQRFFLKGKYQASIRLFSDLLEEGYEPGLTCMSRGVSYLKVGDLEDALRDFDRAIGSDGGDATAFYFRGSARMLDGDYQGAGADFSRAIDANPGHRAALLARGISYVNLGKNADGARDIKKAMRHAEAAIQGFSDVNGWRGQLEKALAAVERDTVREPEDLTDEDIRILKHWMKAA